MPTGALMSLATSLGSSGNWLISGVQPAQPASDKAYDIEKQLGNVVQCQHVSTLSGLLMLGPGQSSYLCEEAFVSAFP